MPFIGLRWRCVGPEAEDLVQVTYAKALERFGSFQAGTNCKTWLLQILRNTWIDELRHRKVAGPTVSIEESQPAVADPARAGETTWTDAARAAVGSQGERPLLRCGCSACAEINRASCCAREPGLGNVESNEQDGDFDPLKIVVQSLAPQLRSLGKGAF